MSNIIVFISGLFIGSFLNCIVYRLEMRDKGGITSFTQGRPRRKAFGFLRGRSFCPHCKHTLSWLDLVPVFSYLFLGGKCQYCRKKISIQYPLVELLTGVLFLLIFSFFDSLIFIPFLLLISCFLIIIFVYDLKHFIIPDRVLFPAIIIALGYVFIFNYELLSNHILSALAAAGFFGAIVLISRGKWMGVGDVKLAILIGLLLGFPKVLVSLFFAFLIGAIIGVGLIFLKKKTLRSEIPFGPFLIVGIYIALFLGDKIINWYLNLIFI